MKAVSLIGPNMVEVVDKPDPLPGEDHVVMKVSMCGICGSDIHFWHHGFGMDKQPGLIMGHEFCGSIHDPGPRADLKPGDRITVIPINPCGSCETCRLGRPNICKNAQGRPIPGLNCPGGYAELCKVRPDMVRLLPDSISDREAAMIEPASVSLHAVRRSDMKPGHSVLIAGGGPVGLLCALWAKHYGASRVCLTEINPYRLDFIREHFNFIEAIDASEKDLFRSIKKRFGPFDRFIDTSASDPGLNVGATCLNQGGKIVLAGINYGLQQLSTLICTLKELDITTAFGYTPDEFDMAMNHIALKNIDSGVLVTRTVNPDMVQNALVGLSSGNSHDIKVLIKFT